jgi:KUP system potassium uptake protein
LFAPFVGLWFLALLVTGAINISNNDPGIFRAYNPGYAINYLVRTQDLRVLGGILLAVTGVEALFADLGHYNRQAIQWTFTLVVYPSLVIAYLGQAAALEVHPEWISNTFYNSIPGGPGSVVYWIVFVLATLATVIASQAMILGTFSIVCARLR